MDSIKNLILLLIVLSAFSIGPILPLCAFESNQSAILVIGQPDLFSNNPNRGPFTDPPIAPDRNTLYWPGGLRVVNGKLLVADYLNHRVLIYDPVPTWNDATAQVVIGQADMISNGLNQDPMGINPEVPYANTLWRPDDIVFGAGKLIISDSRNNRALVFNGVPSENDASAEVVIGQQEISGWLMPNQDSDPRADTLYEPRRIFLDNGRLFITDRNNNRVLIYDSIPTANNAPASVVIGQPDFFSTEINQGLSDSADYTLSGPTGVFISDGKLFITDTDNHRILIFNQVPSENNVSADVVLGQSAFDLNEPNQGWTYPDSSTLSRPFGSVFSDGIRLFVTDNGNHRLLIYNNIPNDMTGAPYSADIVLGQPDMFGYLVNQVDPDPPPDPPSPPQANTLYWPDGVVLYGQNLYVSDTHNNRVLVFRETTPSPTPAGFKTPSPSPTPTVTPISTPTPVPTPSSIPSPVPTAFPTPRMTSTPSYSPPPTATPVPSATATVTATPRPSPSVTPPPSVTPTPSATVTATPRPSPSVTPPPSVTPTPSATVTATPRPSPSVTPPPSVSPTPSATVTATPRPSPSVTPPPSVTPTPSATVTPSVSPTVGVTVTPTPLPSVTPTISCSPTATPSVEPTPPATASPSPTISPPDTRRTRGDYNGDGTSDPAIYRSDSGLWGVRGLTRAYFGGGDDWPVPRDYRGDGTTDIGLFRPASGLWAIKGVTRAYFGGGDDQPVPGYYSGGGEAKLGIYRFASGLWAINEVTRIYFGGGDDWPMIGDFSGDGTEIPAIFRPASGLWAFKGVTRFYFGGAGDFPLTGDFSGDGTEIPAIFRADSGLWAVRGLTRFYFGGGEDFPILADFSGTGTDGLAIYRPASGLWGLRDISRIYFGSPTDVPVVE